MSESQTVVGELAENLQPQAEAEAAAQAQALEAAKQEEAENQAKAPAGPDWARRRIDTLTRQRHEAERRAELEATRAARAEEMLRKMAAAANPEEAQAALKAGPQDGIAPEKLEEVVNARAEQVAAVQRFNDQCNEIYQRGTEEFGDFAERIKLAQTANVLNPAIVEAAVELGDAHKVLYALLSDIDEASRIAELSPVRAAAALAKFVAKSGAQARRVSSAPPPITQVKAVAEPSFDPEKASIQEWMDWRKKQLETRARR